MGQKLSRAFRDKSEEISLCSIILNLAEDTNVVLEQKATYVSRFGHLRVTIIQAGKHVHL